MAVNLKPVTRDDLLPLLQLRVAEAQQQFIVHNALTLAQAAYEPNSHIFGIWVADVPVGLTTLIDMRGYPFLGEGDDANSGYIWRLMIDACHQRKGYGRAALRQIERWAHQRGLPRLYIATAQANVAALRLYHRLGYRPTGRVADGEMALSLLVDPPQDLKKPA